MIRTLAVAAFLSVLAAPALAQDDPAQEPGAARSAWTFAVGAATDNRSKDISKSDGQAYVWGLAEWSSADGLFYAGPGLETIKSLTGSELEAQATVGVRPELAGFDLDLSATHKWQLDADAGADDEAWEFTANAGRSIGPASARLQLQHSPDGLGVVEAWTWVEARVGWDFTEKLEATAAVGRREQDGAPDYTGWNAGITYAATRNIDLDLRYYDTDADAPGEQYEGALVAGISVYF